MRNILLKILKDEKDISELKKLDFNQINFFILESFKKWIEQS